MKYYSAKLTGVPEGSYLHHMIEDKLNWYMYHKEQMDEHKKLMEKAEQEMKNEWESYKRQYEETKQFLEEHPERKQRMREFGHSMPMVENIE